MNRADESNEQLMARVASGSDAALEALIRQFACPLMTFLQRMIGDRQRAEDLFQEVFLAIWTHRRQYRYPERFRCWLFGIAVNRCRAEFRRGRLTTVTLDRESVLEPPDEGLSPVESVMAGETAQLLADAVASLPEQQRSVAVLRIWNGLSYAEIARVMGLREATVRSHMMHGLTTMRRRLEPRRDALK